MPSSNLPRKSPKPTPAPQALQATNTPAAPAPAPQAPKPTTPYGLLGKTLGHSWSPEIHQQLGSAPYALYELQSDQLEQFIRHEHWRGLNVTIPYKQQVARLADSCSDAMKHIGAANTLVKDEKGRIVAHNTDALGFLQLLKHVCTQQLGLPDARTLVAHKKVLVLGSGGASKAIRYVLEQLQAQVVIISRNPPKSSCAAQTANSPVRYDSYESLSQRHRDAVLLVNATPVGMYPNTEASPLSHTQFEALESVKAVIDSIYNPQITRLGQDALACHKVYANGLRMLAAQAWAAAQLFLHKEIDTTCIDRIVHNLAQRMQNVALIGMPGVGKTTTGQLLAQRLGRPFIDLDDAFTQIVGTTPADFIRKHTEAAFRARETEVLQVYAKKSGQILSCGGGVVCRHKNYELLKQNATIVMLNRPLKALSCENRPITQAQSLQALQQARMPLYQQWADISIHNPSSPATATQTIIDTLSLS